MGKMIEIGITERGDAALDHGWLPWVKEGNPAILITKDPYMLYQQLQTMNGSRNFNVIIHATITGMGGSALEPNVPYKDLAIKGYEKLIEFYSVERVVLRIDPVIPTDSGIKVAASVLKYKDPQGRVRISFIDQYPHVKTRLIGLGIPLPWSTFHAPLELRSQAYNDLGRPEICGEPDFLCICTGCVSEIDCKTLKVIPDTDLKGQRKFCSCLMNKKELLKFKEPCFHKCIYCYWGK
jgi:hypothetical protein